MTREEYMVHARKNELPYELLIDYYNKHNTKPNLNFSLESFTDIFRQFLSTFAVNLDHIRSYYDREYNIVTVYDKNNNFVTIF